MSIRDWILLVLIGALVAGCASGESGDLRIVLDDDPAITRGMDAGSGRAQIQDGWSVSFDRYLIVLGEISLAIDGAYSPLVVAQQRVIDMRALPPRGMLLELITGLQATRFQRFGYTLPATTSDDENAIDDPWSHWIEGRLTKTDGQSCPPNQPCRQSDEIAFRMQVNAPAQYQFCANELGITGVAIPAGGVGEALISLRADHLFLNGFVSGHTQLEYRAQWLADADLNADDLVTTEELASIPAGELFDPMLYSTAGAPWPIDTALDFVRAQLITIGHFQGEGECIWEAL